MVRYDCCSASSPSGNAILLVFTHNLSGGMPVDQAQGAGHGSSSGRFGKKVAVVTLHGMGIGSDDYADGLKAKLAALMGQAWQQVSFHAITYHDIHQNQQEQLWQDIKANPSNDIANQYLRRFFLYHFSDALSLERGRSIGGSSYTRIQEAIATGLTHVHQTFAPGSRYPVIFIAHSLGCQVISNYLWDRDHGLHYFSDHRPTWQRLDQLKTLVTLGCNIPVFTAGLAKRQSFRAPTPEFRWHNFYDPDDVLGWPVRQLGLDYERLATDFAINAGGLFTSWNFFSHQGYWTDGDIVHHLAGLIREELSCAEPIAEQPKGLHRPQVQQVAQSERKPAPDNSP